MRVYDKGFYTTMSLTCVGGIAAFSHLADIIANGYDFNSMIFMSSCIGVSLSAATKVPRLYKIHKEFHDIIKTEEYKDYKFLYDEFVTDIAKLFHNIGVKNDLSGAYLFKLCLDSGIFSEIRDVRFSTWENDIYDHFLDVMGGRVATGSYCCRHATSLLTDVINSMGGVAANVSVYSKFAARPGQDDLYANHLVCALVHNDKRVVVDPNISLNLFPAGGTGIIADKIKSINSIGIETLGSLITYEGRKTEFSTERDNKKNLKKIIKYPSLELDSDVFANYMGALDVVSKCANEIEEFHETQLPKIKRLSQLHNYLVPHGKK